MFIGQDIRTHSPPRTHRLLRLAAEPAALATGRDSVREMLRSAGWGR